MGRLAKVTKLPESVRAELNRRLVEHAFGDYEALAHWLGEQGFQIARSSLQRYGSQFERKLEAVTLASAQAREVVAASPDTEGAMGDALTRLVQQEIFALLVESKGHIEKPDLAELRERSRTWGGRPCGSGGGRRKCASAWKLKRVRPLVESAKSDAGAGFRLKQRRQYATRFWI